LSCEVVGIIWCMSKSKFQSNAVVLIPSFEQIVIINVP